MNLKFLSPTKKRGIVFTMNSPNSLYDASSPSLLVEIYEKNFNDLSVIIIEVPSSIKKPVFIKNEGMPQGVYLRAGSNTRKANADYVEELMRENKRVYFDEEAIHVDISLLSHDLLQQVFGRVNNARLVTEKILTEVGAHKNKYYPAVAGMLMFCETPHEYVPEATVQCTRFRGTEGRDIIQTQEIQGCLETQLTTVFRLVRWSVKIALYDNRLEIFSPGNFPGLVNMANLGDGTTYLRNPNLARIARRFGLIEKLGTGIRLMLESCKKAGLKKPEFVEGADSVKVVFHFLPDEENFALDEDKLMALFHMHEEVKLDDVQAYLKVSRNTASRRLNQLLKSGHVRRVGKGPAVRYVKN